MLWCSIRNEFNFQRQIHRSNRSFQQIQTGISIFVFQSANIGLTDPDSRTLRQLFLSYSGSDPASNTERAISNSGTKFFVLSSKLFICLQFVCQFLNVTYDFIPYLENGMFCCFLANPFVATIIMFSSKKKRIGMISVPVLLRSSKIPSAWCLLNGSRASLIPVI